MVGSVSKAKKVADMCMEFCFRKLAKKTRPRIEFKVEDAIAVSIVTRACIDGLDCPRDR